MLVCFLFCFSRCCFFNYWPVVVFFFFFFNDTATTEIYTLSLHDALPIFRCGSQGLAAYAAPLLCHAHGGKWRRSEGTRLNSSHSQISYAVFCLKKKKKMHHNLMTYTICTLYQCCQS